MKVKYRLTTDLREESGNSVISAPRQQQGRIGCSALEDASDSQVPMRPGVAIHAMAAKVEGTPSEGQPSQSTGYRTTRLMFEVQNAILSVQSFMKYRSDPSVDFYSSAPTISAPKNALKRPLARKSFP